MGNRRYPLLVLGTALALPSGCVAGLPPAGPPHGAPMPATGDATGDPPTALPNLEPQVAHERFTQCPTLQPDGATLRFGGDDRPLECSRPGACRPHRKLVGSTLQELQHFAGSPSTCEGEVWTFDFGRPCTQERDILVLRVSGSEVTSAKHEHTFASESCAPA